MKKLLSIILVLVVAIAMISLASCKSTQFDYEEYVSDNRTLAFESTNEYGYFSFIGGQRESPYQHDGKTEQLVDFGLIYFYPKITVGEQYDIVLKINQTETEITLEKNPFDECLMCDCKILPNENDKICVEIGNESFELKNKSKDFVVDNALAFEIGCGEFKTQLSDLTKNNKFYGEIYLMLLPDKLNNFKNFYWYFAIFDGKKFQSVIISTSEKKVVSKTT